MKNIFGFIVLFISLVLLLSCNGKTKDNIEITNIYLKEEINHFIRRVNKSNFCKSEYIMVQIEKDKITLSNTEPIQSSDLIGISTFKNSHIFFYSNADYSNYIKIKKELKNMEFPENYSSECDPLMYRILIIDKEDKNKFHYPSPPNLKNVK